MQSRLKFFKCNIRPSTLTIEWSSICNNLSSEQAIKALHRFTSSIIDKLERGEEISDDSCNIFLEREVTSDILNLGKINTSSDLTINKSLDLLHKRIIDLNRESRLDPKHVSLSLNSYAKFYKDLTSNNSFYKFNLVNLKDVKGYINELLDIATKNIKYMNEQDLSLVLNCISKMNIRRHDFLNSANHLLGKSLEEFRRLGLNIDGREYSDNLIKNLTPQGAGLLLNCFAKCNVELNKSLVNFFVEYYVPKMRDRFPINHLVMCLHGLIKYNVPVSKLSSRLREADKLLNDIKGNYDIKLISFALYTLSKYNYYPSISIKNIFEYLTEADLRNVSEVNFCNIYYALGKLNLRDTKTIDNMNECVVPNLKKFTPHAIVGIYYSLSRLDYKKKLTKEPVEGPAENTESKSEYAGSPSLENRFISEFIKFFKSRSLMTSMFNSNSRITLAPIQLINFTFSCAINCNMEPWIYNYLLNKLVCIIEKWPTDHKLFKKDTNIFMNYRKEFNEYDQYKFLSKYVGIKGSNQLNCILQHVMRFIKGGLWSLDYVVLNSLNTLFDDFNFNLEHERNPTIDDIMESEGDEDNSSDEMSEPVTSRIHESVYLSIRRILSSESDSNGQKSKWSCSSLFIYKEHKAFPYVIDIVVFKF